MNTTVDDQQLTEFYVQAIVLSKRLNISVEAAVELLHAIAKYMVERGL